MERKRARKQQKKNKKIVFTVVGILGVGIIAGGSYFGYQHVQKKKKEEALNLFVDNLEKKEFNKLVTAFSADSFRQVGMTKEEVIDKYSAIFNSIGLSKIDGKIDSLNKDDFSVNVKMETPFGSLKDLHYKGEFVKEGSDYKLSWNYSFIFPDMEEGDKVFMSHEMPKRGTIYDINNNPLATETQYPQYGIVPKELGEGDTKTENLKKISEELDISVDDINQSLSQGWV
ncbi:MAG: NTF2-like N-terminal transpeptidase domain-containing protein, partial [Vagococcus sp.]